jgi:hypothetical protein
MSKKHPLAEANRLMKHKKGQKVFCEGPCNLDHEIMQRLLPAVPEDKMVVGSSGGMKKDGTKPVWALLPLDAVEECVKVMTFGAQKYRPGNWKKVEPHRYFSAMLRHLTAIQAGEKIDPDSQLMHISHVLCNAVFLTWFHLHGELKIDVPE